MLDINLRGVVIGSRLALERFVPRNNGHLVNIASSAGKFSPPGIATYAATKHAVVGLTEALRTEHRGSGLEFSIVMPGIVRTDMIAGYGKARLVDEIEPADVACAIADALEHPRRDVFVPRSLGALNRLTTLLPLRATEALERFLRIDRVLTEIDPADRAEYEARAARSDPRREPAEA
jgi:short-subunit dehydrogenase